MLKASNLGYERDNRLLFSNLTFEIKPASMLLVSGKNGVGKSSLLKILAGLWQPSEGSLMWQGRDKLQEPAFLSQVLYLGHKLAIQPTLTPIQNLQWLLGITAAEIFSRAQILSALEKVGLEDFERVPCEVLSKGQCQRLALARLWLDPPKYWILDEPMTSLDEAGVELLHQRILMHLEQQGLLVMASHRPFCADYCKQINKIEIVLGHERC